jgi:hypothetical protein
MDSKKPSSKICLLCPEFKREAILSKNFARHLRSEHNSRYQQLMEGRSQRCGKPEFNVDYIWSNEEPNLQKKSAAPAEGNPNLQIINFLIEQSNEHDFGNLQND